MSELEDFATAEPTKPVPVKPAPAKPERKQPPPPQHVAKVEPPPPQRVVSVEPPPARPAPVRSSEPILAGTKKSAILFAVGATDPAASAVQTVKALAGDLSAALSDGSA